MSLVALLAGGAALAQVGVRAVRHGWPDFEYFYKAGRSLVVHGSLDPGYDRLPDGRIASRGSIDWYLPFVPRLMALLAWLPYRSAGLVWLAINLLALVAVLRLAGRHLAGLPRGDWPVTQLLPFFALYLCWWWEFRLNQIDLLVLLLLAGCFACWQRAWWWSAGFWLGLAVLIKLTPALLLGWFLLKRQTRTVAAALLTVLLAGPVADTVVLGPSAARDAYQGWAERTLVRGSQRGLILAGREMDWRNQAFGAVLTRWLHPVNYSTHFDNDPRLPADPKVRTLNVAMLPRPVVARLVLVIQLLTLAGLLWLWRRPAAHLTPWQLRLEWTVGLAAMLWFMPVLRVYHLVWLYPLLAATGGALHKRGWRDRWTRITLGCLGSMLAAELAALAAVARAEPWYGLHAGGVLLAMVPLGIAPAVAALRRLARDGAWLPE